MLFFLKVNGQAETTDNVLLILVYLFIYLLYMKPMHNELKTLTNVTK